MSPLDSFHLSFPASRFPSHGLTRPRANLRATIAVYPSTFSSLSIPHSIQLSFSSSTSFSRPSSYRPLVLALPSRRIVFSLPTRERDHSRLLIHQRERIRDVRGENYGLRVRSRCCCVNKRQHGTPREDIGDSKMQDRVSFKSQALKSARYRMSKLISGPHEFSAQSTVPP